METKTLFQLSADMAAIEDALWESGGEFTEELALALSETETGLSSKADGYASLIRSFASQRAIIKQEIDRLTRLARVAENAEKRIKEHICEVMGTFGMTKIEGKLSKISRVKTSSMETDEELLLSGYQVNLAELNNILPPYVTAELKVSKTAIKEFQKESGILPSGVEIKEKYSIRIR